jgi:arylsulfatase A-like enzyme
MKSYSLILLLFLSSYFSFAQKKEKPNIIIILADDLGFSDLGCYGSEIHTPNLDKLAKEGLKMTQFYNAGRCCPSRASLLTGLYPHQAGIGDMLQYKGSPAYQGYLSDSCVTIAQLLKEAGYTTITSGKWHVGLDSSAWACKRGFDKSFTLMNNGASYFNSEPLYNDGRKVTFMKDDHEVVRKDTNYYLTQAFTDFAVKALEEEKNSRQPFFLYLTYNAPHWPIQAPQEAIEKYKKLYEQGWEKCRNARYQNQVKMGLIKEEWKLSPKYSKVPDWNSLSKKEKESWSLRMAIYAAMVDRMDQGVGEIINKLKEIKKLENTIIIFLSDNGGSADDVKNWNYVTQKSGLPGSIGSIDSYETPWGNVSNTPFKLFKKNIHEGGISTPFIAYYPQVIKAGRKDNQLAHIMDLMPTCLDLAGVEYPKEFHGKTIKPIEGKSLLPVLQNKVRPEHEIICWEHEGSKAVRKGKWKLEVEYPGQKWELYDMEKDRTEDNNLAEKYPELVEELEKDFKKWSEKVGVEDWNTIK